jgi:hypothetical protein
MVSQAFNIADDAMAVTLDFLRLLYKLGAETEATVLLTPGQFFTLESNLLSSDLATFCGSEPSEPGTFKLHGVTFKLDRPVRAYRSGLPTAS